MPVISYNPSVFIQRLEDVGDGATKQIVVNTISTMKVADSINILGNDYLIASIDTNLNIITLDKDREPNIDLITNPVIEVKHNAPDTSINLQTPDPISDVDKRQKLIALGKEYYQRKLNKSQFTLGNDYYQLEYFLDNETRAYMGTFNKDLTPILHILARASSETTDAVATKYKKKLVLLHEEISLLKAQYLNLAQKVYEAQSQQDLDLIIFQ